MSLCLPLNQSFIRKHFFQNYFEPKQFPDVLVASESCRRPTLILPTSRATRHVRLWRPRETHPLLKCDVASSSSVPARVCLRQMPDRLQPSSSAPFSSIFHPRHVESFLTLPQINQLCADIIQLLRVGCITLYNRVMAMLARPLCCSIDLSDQLHSRDLLKYIYFEAKDGKWF